MKLSVVISTIPERCVLLTSALANIVNQTQQPDEIIVVTDSGRKKEVLELIPDKLFSLLSLRVVESEGKGLSKARNKGVECSTGDIVIFLDDDVVITDPTIFFRVREAFEEDEHGMLGVYGVQVKPLLFNSVRLPDKFNWIYGCTDDKAVRPVGAFFAVRKSLFRVVGLFSEELGRKGNLISGEETEFFERVRRIGLKVVLDSRYTVYHLIMNRGWRYVLKRAFAEGVSKGMFRNYDYGVEKKYAIRYLGSPIGLIVLGATLIGFLTSFVKTHWVEKWKCW